MKVINQSFEWIIKPNIKTLKTIELAGRTCYKSEDKITNDSCMEFVDKIMGSGHLSVIEHSIATIKFITDRGVSHEFVRHRLASFSQESTRYANYSKLKFGSELTVIKPCWFNKDYPNIVTEDEKIWEDAMKYSEQTYFKLLSFPGYRAQEARAVLPNSLKTEIVVSANLREWLHILNLRCDKSAHPQFRNLVLPLLDEFTDLLPSVFGDLYTKYESDIVKLKFPS